jgi:hypothetical protein
VERLLKCLDDVDDLMVVFRVQAPMLITTGLLLAGLVTALGIAFLLGPYGLHAAP